MRLSKLANEITTSPILTLAAAINEKIGHGEKIYNLTIGDFNPQIFPVPSEFETEVKRAYDQHQTNYPGAAGVANLRSAISGFLKHYGDLTVAADNILISSGARPLIYSAYRAIVDPDDKVIYPVPSWNNHYYTHFTRAEKVELETTPETYFMPDVAEIAPHLKGATLLALCSPLNPTGTVMSAEGLEKICDLVIAENRSRGADQKPLYVLFDQIYWLLTFGETRHFHAGLLRPEMKDYAIFIDGFSKAFAGTGVRLGWAYGPADVLKKMRTIVAHMGAWAPRAEQVAASNYLKNFPAIDRYLTHFRSEIRYRLDGFYAGFKALKSKGFSVDAIEPQAAIYLTVQFALQGQKTPDGKVLATNSDVHQYLLDEAKVGLVPFSYFGASEQSNWYRLSVGTCHKEEVETIIGSLENALRKLSA